LPGAKTAVVKYAIDNFSARCLSVSETTARIYEASRAALQTRNSLVPFLIDPPIVVRIELMDAAQAGMASGLPSVRRDGTTAVAFETSTVREAYGLLGAIGSVADSVRS
jgi:D-aminopeptidase